MNLRDLLIITTEGKYIVRVKHKYQERQFNKKRNFTQGQKV